MTWTRSAGGICETGLSLACPKAAELILLHNEPTVYHETQDAQTQLPPVTEAAARICDARRTMELLLQDRSLGFRPGLVLSLAYSAALEPLIRAKNRYAYEELDWGFTEQPHRQFQALVQFLGSWELKRSDMCNLLWEFQLLCAKDDILVRHLDKTLKLFQALSGEEYRLLRDQFDQYMDARAYLFENLLNYYLHRYFMGNVKQETIAPGVKLMVISTALLRALSARIWRETGTITDEAFTALCWRYARCVEESPETSSALYKRLDQMPLFSWDRLQRLLWQ